MPDDAQEGLASMADERVVRSAARHYDGGVRQLVADALSSGPDREADDETADERDGRVLRAVVAAISGQLAYHTHETALAPTVRYDSNGPDGFSGRVFTGRAEYRFTLQRVR
jgi:hypothetical protein